MRRLSFAFLDSVLFGIPINMASFLSNLPQTCAGACAGKLYEFMGNCIHISYNPIVTHSGTFHKSKMKEKRTIFRFPTGPALQGEA